MPRNFSMMLLINPVWITDIIPVVRSNVPWSFVLKAMDAYTYALQIGSMPTGTVISSSGQISGIPTVPGTYVFTVRATGDSSFTDKELTVNVENLGLWITTSVPNQRIGLPTSFQLDAGSVDSYVIQSGALPTGLSISTLGLISGTPTSAGPFEFTVRATNSTLSLDLDLLLCNYSSAIA